MASRLNSNSNNNTAVANLKSGLQTSDHMSRRRKRHFNKMSFMLLIFVGCCLTLILSPLHVQAKESNNATSKGENMLSNDRQSHQHEEKGETNINADKTNDNGTFKRLQKTSDIKIDIEKPVEEEGEEEAEEDDDEHSSEVIEMIQPAHTLRHQEHYKQRMLQAENHKQQKNLQHLDGNANTDADDGDGDDAEEQEQERELSQYNRNLRYRQIQQALREPIALPAPPHHHRRHEQHLAKQRLAKQTELTWPQQHHLRHQHHHHQQTQEFPHHNQPQLRHLKHEMRKQNITATKIKTLAHQRYFDRESSYINPLANIATTEGPHLRHTGSNLHWQSIGYPNNPHNHLFGDEANNNNNPKEEDIKRFSLSLDGHENENEREQEHEKAKANQNGKGILDDKTMIRGEEDDGDDVNSNYDDDYSYDDDDDDNDDDNSKEINKANNYPSIASSNNAKTNVKRYTNSMQQMHKPSSLLSSSFDSSPSSTAYALRKQYAGHHVRRKPTQHMDVLKTNSYNNNKDHVDDDEDDEEDDDYDDIENNEDKSENASSSKEGPNDDNNNDDDDDGDKMSDEKWNKIEHEHYRKQLQHQRAMQALRSRRPQNANTPVHAQTMTLNNNKYSMHSPSAIAPAASSTYNSNSNNAWTKRQTINNGENDNIYSRYYVPGSVTRKKEEELGSPAAILESRRQYALQQRQNKALASAHHRRIVTEGSCRLPQPRVERIRRDSWKIYTPHCTILHRCTDDAGCCPSERQTCAPKRTKNVDLYFFVISLNETQGSIEKLSFANHTECHCVDRSKQRAPEYANSAAKDLLVNSNQIPYLRRATILNCYCPNLFEKILQEDGYCRCDCSSGNMGCDWLKRGMEHFSMNDRKCIIEGRCKLPTCEYGQYIKKHGRCPRREERHLSADIDW